jgi:hypothetical protein
MINLQGSFNHFFVAERRSELRPGVLTLVKQANDYPVAERRLRLLWATFNRRSATGDFSHAIPGVETPGYAQKPLCGWKIITSNIHQK